MESHLFFTHGVQGKYDHNTHTHMHNTHTHTILAATFQVNTGYRFPLILRLHSSISWACSRGKPKLHISSDTTARGLLWTSPQSSSLNLYRHTSLDAVCIICTFVMSNSPNHRNVSLYINGQTRLTGFRPSNFLLFVFFLSVFQIKTTHPSEQLISFLSNSAVSASCCSFIGEVSLP